LILYFIKQSARTNVTKEEETGEALKSIMHWQHGFAFFAVLAKKVLCWFPKFRSGFAKEETKMLRNCMMTVRKINYLFSDMCAQKDDAAARFVSKTKPFIN